MKYVWVNYSLNSDLMMSNPGKIVSKLRIFIKANNIKSQQDLIFVLSQPQKVT